MIADGIDKEAWDMHVAGVCTSGGDDRSTHAIGAIVSSHFHRLVFSYLIYIIDSSQFLVALIILQPWTHKHTATPVMLCTSSTESVH